MCPWNAIQDVDNHSLCESENVFHEPIEIIMKQFPLSVGDLKITNDKYGYVILKEKMKRPKLFNQKLVNARPVMDIAHSEESKKIFLKLKPKKRKGKTCNDIDTGDEIVLSGELVKSLYKEFIERNPNYN